MTVVTIDVLSELRPKKEKEMNLSSCKNCLTIVALALLALIAMPLAARASGGNVLPPEAMPYGYTLNDMASALALFNTSGNSPSYYPNTPLQILYVDPASITSTFPGDGGLIQTGTNSFTLATGRMFFVPLIWEDDSPPIIGNFPNDRSDAAFYIFDPSQVGFIDGAIAVDGKTTEVGAPYLAGPVKVPYLLDGDGTHVIQLGVFLTPLSPGRHTVTISGRFAGSAFAAASGLAYLAFTGTYTVIVTPTH